jgi:hypothetical protein
MWSGLSWRLSVCVDWKGSALFQVPRFGRNGLLTTLSRGS